MLTQIRVLLIASYKHLLEKHLALLAHVGATAQQILAIQAAEYSFLSA
jgi:hypothetical protein